ncbi:hypothetical protein [Sphingosinicella sp. BN140058]|uniref:hypothetical protein n=1 Tax=Sphingosinicella sp. BN140058 TaxID=1892855 RepID=UPI001010B9CB|nr:hypothetical protein [Sphingosinicella sp. BN140058]QAY80176.1 hypothetical protein ETR14_26395 [Sphingosinicella sp. BN140058]
MKKIQGVPSWFAADPEASGLTWLPVPTVVFGRDGRQYFDGFIGEMLAQEKIPHAIEVVLDGHTWKCLARLAYGDGSDEQAVFTYLESESFARLWNSDATTVHALPEDCITLSLEAADTRFPFVTPNGVICDLFFHEGRFVAQPHEAAAFDFIEQAA